MSQHHWQEATCPEAPCHSTTGRRPPVQRPHVTAPLAGGPPVQRPHVTAPLAGGHLSRGPMSQHHWQEATCPEAPCHSTTGRRPPVQRPHVTAPLAGGPPVQRPHVTAPLAGGHLSRGPMSQHHWQGATCPEAPCHSTTGRRPPVQRPHVTAPLAGGNPPRKLTARLQIHTPDTDMTLTEMTLTEELVLVNKPSMTLTEEMVSVNKPSVTLTEEMVCQQTLSDADRRDGLSTLSDTDRRDGLSTNPQ